MSTLPSKFSLNTENSSTTTPSRPKLPPTNFKTTIQHPNTPGSKTSSPAQKKLAWKEIRICHGVVISRQPKTTVLTSSNVTGTVVATDDGWLNDIGVGGGSGDAFWETDNISLEMLTDANNGNVDEASF